mmetsp:Transcript_29649/g.76050  ORF Transcript_29649/g.76050 Transcript_29649/m.76050 type:complete len:382 (-) Transcript_29649:1349-2494(-)
MPSHVPARTRPIPRIARSHTQHRQHGAMVRGGFQGGAVVGLEGQVPAVEDAVTPRRRPLLVVAVSPNLELVGRRKRETTLLKSPQLQAGFPHEVLVVGLHHVPLPGLHRRHAEVPHQIQAEIEIPQQHAAVRGPRGEQALPQEPLLPPARGAGDGLVAEGVVEDLPHVAVAFRGVLGRLTGRQMQIDETKAEVSELKPHADSTFVARAAAGPGLDSVAVQPPDLSTQLLAHEYSNVQAHQGHTSDLDKLTHGAEHSPELRVEILLALHVAGDGQNVLGSQVNHFLQSNHINIRPTLRPQPLRQIVPWVHHRTPQIPGAHPQLQRPIAKGLRGAQLLLCSALQDTDGAVGGISVESILNQPRNASTPVLEVGPNGDFAVADR